MISTLGAIYKEVVKIRTMMEPKPTPDSDVAELRARESELEASRIGEKGIKETTKSLKGAGGVGGSGQFPFFAQPGQSICKR